MQQPALRAHPERTAWLVLWSAFAVFCLLVVCVPLGVRHVLFYSMRSHSAILQTLSGTVKVESLATGRIETVSKDHSATLSEGSVITLDDNSEADLRFFNGSFVHLRPGSQLVFERAQSARFSMGKNPDTIRLRSDNGRLKIVTTRPLRRNGLDFLVRLPLLGGEISVQDGGVCGAEIQPNGADIFVHSGSALVRASGQEIYLMAPERTTLEMGRPPSPPVAYARELLVNGDFSKCLDEGWTAFNDQGNDGGNVDGVWNCDDSTHTVRFYRTGSQRNHCETIIEQEIDRDLPDPVSSLVVRANVKVVSQSLSGGGYLASEFPLMIRLKYRDQYGSENEWVHAFYVENSQNNPTVNGEEIPQNEWHWYESVNLLDSLDPKPSRIVSLRVYASGWDYESMISYISVAVQ